MTGKEKPPAAGKAAEGKAEKGLCFMSTLSQDEAARKGGNAGEER